MDVVSDGWTSVHDAVCHNHRVCRHAVDRLVAHDAAFEPLPRRDTVRAVAVHHDIKALVRQRRREVTGEFVELGL